MPKILKSECGSVVTVIHDDGREVTLYPHGRPRFLQKPVPHGPLRVEPSEGAKPLNILFKETLERTHPR